LKKPFLVLGLLLLILVLLKPLHSGQTPNSPQKLWGDDVRIGDLDSIYAISFDVCRQNGNLFLAFLFQDGGATYLKRAFSSDGGENWRIDHSLIKNAAYRMNGVSGTVLGNYFFFAHTYGAANTAIDIYRARISDGARVRFPNDSEFIRLTPQAVGDSIKEVVLVSDEDFLGQYLNLFFITRSCTLKYFYSDTAGYRWLQIPTGVTDAKCGLDACTNEGYDTNYAFVSYITTTDSLEVDGFTYNGDRGRLIRSWVGPLARFTSVGAYHDTVIAVYERSGYNAPYYCLSLTSFNGGLSWYLGIPGGEDTTYTICAPDVACRARGGQGVIYFYGTGGGRRPRYTWRNYRGPWSTPVEFGDYQPRSDARPAIEYLGGDVYGCVYLSANPVYGAAYFDRTVWTGVEEETESTRSCPVSLSITPNPGKTIIKLNYSCRRAGKVHIAIYDPAGRLVLTPGAGIQSAGHHTLNVDTHHLSAGVYLVKIETPEGLTTAPLTISR
jgi:hypothetical protein